MKNIFPIRRLALVATLLAMPVTASVTMSSIERVGRYDFAYQVSAQNRVRPVQVFDDGQNTYFQFLGGDAVPAIFRVTEDGPELTIQSFEGPYIRVEGVAAQYMLRLGSASGRVVYTAPGRSPWPSAQPSAQSQSSSGIAQMVATASPVALSQNEARPRAIDTNSYATPARGDVTRWAQSREESEEHEFAFPKGTISLSRAQLSRVERITNGLAGDYHIVVTGRDDSDLKEGIAEGRGRALAQALRARGIPEQRIEIRSSSFQRGAGETAASHVQVSRTVYREIAPSRVVAAAAQAAAPLVVEIPPTGFTFEKSDQTIGGAIRRWAGATQYQVVWELPKDADPVITARSRLNADSMRQALEMVATGMKAKGYDMQVSIYRNRVIRVSQNP